MFIIPTYIMKQDWELPPLWINLAIDVISFVSSSMEGSKDVVMIFDLEIRINPFI